MRIINYLMGLKLQTKMLLGFGIVMILSLIIGLHSLNKMIGLHRSTEQLFEQDMLGISHIKEASINLVDIDRSLRQMILASDSVQLMHAKKRIEADRTHLQAELKEGRMRISRAESIKLFAEFEILGQMYLQKVDTIIRTFEEDHGNPQRARQILLSREFDEVGERTTAKLFQLTKNKEKGARESLQQTTSQYERARFISILLALSGLLGGGCLAWLTTVSISRPLAALRSTIQDLAAGRLHVVVPNTELPNEIGAMAQSVQILQQVAIALDQQRRIKECLADVDQATQTASSFEAFSDALTARLAALLGLVYGALYLLEKKTSTLRRAGGYGCDDSLHTRCFVLGEGLVGQAAFDRRHIILTLPGDDPLGVSTGLGTLTVKTILIFPVVDHDEVLAVLELGTLGSFDPQHQAFLDALLPIMAIKMQALAGTVSTRILLEETQTQALALAASEQQLRSRRDELEKINEQLGKQARQVQEQGDELERQRDSLLEQRRELETKQENLVQTEERNRLILSSVHEGIMGLDTEGKTMFVNQAAAAMLGYSEQELLTVPMHDTIHHSYPDGSAYPREKCHMNRSTKDGVARKVDDEVMWRKDKTSFPVEYSTTPIHKNGILIGTVAVFRDITGHKQAEEKLQHASFLSDQALDLTKSGYWLIDYRDLEYYISSARTAAILGEHPKPDYRYHLRTEWRNRIAAVDPHIAEATDTHLAAAIAGKIPRFDTVYCYKRPSDSKVVWIHAIANVTRDNEGIATFMYGVAQDITAIKGAEQALEETAHQAELASQHFNTLFNTSTMAHVIINSKAEIVASNDALLKMLGYASIDRIRGKHPAALAPSNQPNGRNSMEMGTEMIDISISTGRHTFEWLCQDAHGVSIPVEATMVPVTMDGEPHLMGMLHDLRSRHEIERQLRIAVVKAEEATRAKSDFLANMSHEIRTPMNAIMGMAHLALQTNLDPRQRNYLGKINTAAKNLLGILDDILNFSKIEAGMLTFERADFFLEDVMDHVADQSINQAQEKGLELLFDVGTEVPTGLVGDPLRLGQIILNLVNNAIKFTEKGEITLRVKKLNDEPDGVRLRFEVKDTGIGVSEEQRRLLFSAFSQADASTTRKYGGTGLGLTICKRMVELMEGEIGFDSQPGVGSTFHFTATFGVQNKPRRLTISPDDVKGMRILVVDDDAIAREILQSMLLSLKFEATAVTSGVEAIGELKKALLVQRPYRLVLMDWKMPGMDGVEAIQQIRANTPVAETPSLIVVTAFSRDELLHRAEGVKLDGVLVKPVSPSTLLDSILNALGKKVALPARRHEKRSTTGRKIETPDIPGLDIKPALVRVGGNAKILNKLIVRFHEVQADVVSRIRTALEKKDTETAMRAAHTLKGLAGNIGASLLGECAGRVEGLLNRGELGDLEEALQKLESETKRVIQCISDSMDTLVEKEESRPAKQMEVDRKALGENVRVLATLLEKSDPEAVHVIERLIPSFTAIGQKSAGRELQKLIENFDFDLATERLREIARTLELPQ